MQSPLQPGSARSGTLLCCPSRARLPTVTWERPPSEVLLLRPHQGRGPPGLAPELLLTIPSAWDTPGIGTATPPLRPLQEAPPDPPGAAPLACVAGRRWPRVPSFGSISESHLPIAHLQLTQRRTVHDSSIKLPGNVARVPCSPAIPAPGQNGVEVRWGRPVLSHKSPHSLRLLWEGPPHV